MDAFDQISAEFARSTRRLDPTCHVTERERPARKSVKTLPQAPAAHQSASTDHDAKAKRLPSKRGRQSKRASSPKNLVSAGQSIQQSDALALDVSCLELGVGDDEGAHTARAVQPTASPLVVNDSESLGRAENHSPHALGGDEGAHIRDDFHHPTSPLVAEVTQLWRMRQRWHRAERSLILQAKAVCRSWTGGDRDEADKLYTAVAKGADADPVLTMALMPFREASGRFEAERTAIEKRLRKLSEGSPLWPWASEIKGFGSLNLAAVIGEAGEIAGYRNPSCLWKRMGLAVIEGGRQRRVSNAEAALVHGYAPARRCVAYLLGDTLIKSGDRCRYRPVYTARREHTATTHPDWTKAHSHNDAARYMVKRVLRELWSEARRIEREA